MNHSFENKVALVTGGASGIGLGVGFFLHAVVQAQQFDVISGGKFSGRSVVNCSGNRLGHAKRGGEKNPGSKNVFEEAKIIHGHRYCTLEL